MTQQRPDICFIQGVSYALRNFPLEPVLAELGLEVDPDDEPAPSDCWRGYVATWALQGERGYLLAVRRSGSHAPAVFRASAKVRHGLAAPASPGLDREQQVALRDWLLSGARRPLPVPWLGPALCLA